MTNAYATLPQAIWRTPATWGETVYCTWEQLSKITADLQASGIVACNYDADQFILLGNRDRAIARGWYHHAGYCTSDGRTYWTEHCVMINTEMALLKEVFIEEPEPAEVTTQSERSFLMRCLATA